MTVIIIRDVLSRETYSVQGAAMLVLTPVFKTCKMAFSFYQKKTRSLETYKETFSISMLMNMLCAPADFDAHLDAVFM